MLGSSRWKIMIHNGKCTTYHTNTRRGNKLLEQQSQNHSTAPITNYDEVWDDRFFQILKLRFIKLWENMYSLVLPLSVMFPCQSLTSLPQQYWVWAASPPASYPGTPRLPSSARSPPQTWQSRNLCRSNNSYTSSTHQHTLHTWHLIATYNEKQNIMGIIMVELKLVVLLLTWGSITWIVSCSCLAYMGKTIVLA